MTAASQHLASPAPRAPRWERLLIFLGICLPVPLFAATGLTIPLPATVERLAAALVPWVETAMVDSNRALLHGTIVLAPGEHGESAAPLAVIVSEHRSPTDGAPQGDGGVKATNGTDTNPVGPEAGPAKTIDDSKPEAGTNPDPGGTDPGGEPEPVQDTVDTVGQTVGSAVEDVEATADEVLAPATDDLLDGTVTGILPERGG